jgi:uncharacterized protein YcbK (DUF882 family)
MKLTPHFRRQEFDCHDGTIVPFALLNNVTRLAENLEVIRAEIGEPLYVNSGYRSPKYNEKIGGKDKSYHKKAKAADLTTKNKTPKQLFDVIEGLITEGKIVEGGVGLYAGFVHYDIRGTKARWKK